MKELLLQYRGLKREVYILFAGRLVTAMGAFVWPIMTFFLTVRLGFSDARAAAIMATAAIASLPAAMLGGKLADRISRKKIILFFDLLSVSLYLLAAALPITVFSAGLIFLAALSQTMEHPAYEALNADYSLSSQRDKAYSLSYLGYNLGYIVGASAAGLLFREHLKLAFTLNGLAVFASTVLIFFFVDPANAIGQEAEQTEYLTEYERPVEQSLSVWRALGDRRVVLAALILSGFGFFPGHVVGVLLPLQLKTAMGEAGAAIYGYLNALNGLVVIVFTPLLAVLLKRLTEIPKVFLGAMLYVAGMLLFSVPGSVWLLFAGMTVLSVGEAATVLGEKPYPSRRIPASHRGRVGGIVSILNHVVSSSAQYATALVLALSGSDYRAVWYLFALIGGATALIYGCLYPFDRRRFPLLYGKKETERQNIQK